MTAGLRLGLVALLVLAGDVAVSAQPNPFGIGLPERGLPPVDFGPLAPIAAQIAVWQADLYRMFSAAVRAVRTDLWAAGFLAGLAFLYGVVHAAGPGHGKAVVSAYLLATEATLKRGIVIAVASALLQGAVAIAVVGVMSIVLQATALSMTRAGHVLELMSHALIIGIGLVLIVRAVRALIPRRAPASLSAAASHAPDGSCCPAPIPDPKRLAGRFDLMTAASAVLAVGIRPCTGAILVLIFALTQQVFAVGVLAVVAMSIGTAITVSLLAVAAVSAKGLAVRFAAPSTRASAVIAGIVSLLGGLVVLAFGALLMAAALGRGAAPV